MPTSSRAAPAMRNWSAIVVLPEPGLPSSRCSRLRAKPPPSTKSSPATPVLARGKRGVVASIGLPRCGLQIHVRERQSDDCPGPLRGERLAGRKEVQEGGGEG